MTEFDLGRIIPIDKGEWNDTYSTDAGPGYEKLDKVTSGSGSYLSLVANNTAPLTDRESWFPYVDGASIDALVVALNTAKQNAITAAESANAKALFAEEKGNLADTKAGEAESAKVAANTAAAAASTAAGNANDAATAANSAAGLANTARTELTTAVNTKLGEADGKIEEMNATLSAYDGRVAQVEEDIDQLAVDVNQKEAGSNKQNSLTADGTGAKFPTVDAVNAELRLTLTQQLANGGFSGGMTGWDAGLTGQTQTVTDGVYKVVRLTTSDRITALRSTSETTVNDNAYYFARVRVLQAGATNISFVYASESIAAQSSPVANQWYFISQTNAFQNKRRIGVTAIYPTGEALAGYGIEVDYMGMINLTAIFGTGYEPTKSEMDILMQLIPNNYFEGTLSLTQKQIMNWVLKLIRQNRAATIALGGTII